MPMISYAQNAEDVLLERVFAGQADGFYIDVGANDPVRDSVTKHFSLRGWRGVNVEPIPFLCARLRADRPRDVNLNVGLSDREGELTLYEDPRVESWTANPELLVNYFRSDRAGLVARTVPVLTLAQVCERHVPGPIDFLKIDVECHERAVIAGGDWARWRPRVVLVEAAGWESWEPLLRDADYHFAAFDGINRFYVRAEDRALAERLAAPANFTDDYIPHRYHHQIEALRARLRWYGDPLPFDVPPGLRRLAGRYPSLARVARRLAGRAP
jgi:FkbM family methyltransferase